MGIVLSRAATEDGFVEVVGERMALLGREDGVFEGWMWPLKLFHDLRVGLAVPAARRVEVTPGELAFIHEADGIRLRQEMFACRDRRGLVLLFTLEEGETLDVELSFRCDLRPMWPAGLGGQLARADTEADAFCLTEELGRFAALIGAVGAEVVVPASVHALPDEPVRIRLTCQPGETRALVIAGAEVEPEPLSAAARRGGGQSATGFARAATVVDRARELWLELADDWASERERVHDHWRRHLAGVTEIEVPGRPAYAEAFSWSLVALERAWVSVDGVGRGLVAGLAPSGGGERPGYGWFFDGDAMAAARALAGAGDFDGVRDVLRFAAEKQRDDGKLMHELTLSAKLCDWLGDYPYAYYKALNTPDFVACLAHFVALSGDLDLARELWPAATKAVDWCATCMDDAGRIAIPLAGIAAIEAGPLSDEIDSEIFLQGALLGALQGAVYLAAKLGLNGARFTELLERAENGLETFWSFEHKRYGFAHLASRERCDDLSAYTGAPLARRRGLAERARATVQALNRPQVASDWGVRMFATDSPVYDPTDYNTGAVFPYLTNFVTLAQFVNGNPIAGHQVFASQVNLVHFGGLGLLEEHLEGERAVVPARGVPHQIFSSAAIVESALFGLLGLEVYALARRVVLRPSLPPTWDEIRLRRLRVGATRLDLRVVRTRGETATTWRLEVEQTGPELRVVFEPVLPPLSIVEEELRAEIQVREGPGIELPSTLPARGETSRNPRLVRQEVGEDFVRWTFAGRAGDEVRLPFHCDVEVEVGGAELTDSLLGLTFPGSATHPWTETTVRVQRA